MAFNKLEELRKYLKSKVGDPIIEICSQERDALDVAVSNASVNYWTALPYEKLGTVPGTVLGGEYTITVDSLLDAYFTDPDIKDAAYYLGIVRYDLGERLATAEGSRFDRCLSGAGGYNVGSNYLENRYYRHRIIDSDRLLLEASQSDIIAGEIDYRYDEILGTINLIIPAAVDEVTLWHGFGFDPDFTIAHLPMMHFDMFRKIVAMFFLEIVIAARTAIELQADFTVNISAIESDYTNLKEEVSQELKDMARFTVQWG